VMTYPVLDLTLAGWSEHSDVHIPAKSASA
jgi:hypothetical protein